MSAKDTVTIPGKGTIEKRGSWFVAISDSGIVLSSTKSYFKTLSEGFGISDKEADLLTQQILLGRS